MDDTIAQEPISEQTEEQKIASENAKWYIIHTYSGHENKVAKSLKQRVE